MNNDLSSGARRRRKSVVRSEGESRNKDRWILSYADFITLMFAFFVALYALSAKNSGDENELKKVLDGVFDSVQKSIQPINIGDPVVSVNNEEAPPTAINPISIAPSAEEKEEKKASLVYDLLSQLVESEFTGLADTGQISVSESADWVNLELKSALLFNAGEYDLTNEAVALLMIVANVLKVYPSVILVEGNTDDVPVTSSRLVSNWHLSSLRSSSVVDELVFQGIDPKVIAPLGFSSMHPKVNNINASTRRENRRVVIRISKHNADNIQDYLFN